MKFEAGNKVKCIRDSGTDFLTLGKVYQLLPCSERNRVKAIGDDGKSRTFYMDRWELVKDTPTIEELVAQGKALIGKPCSGGPRNVEFIPNELIVLVDEKLCTGYSIEVLKNLKDNGISVVVRDSIKRASYPVTQTKLVEFIPTTIQLTPDYDAIVYEGYVKVGCQNIPHSKIDELYKLIHDKD